MKNSLILILFLFLTLSCKTDLTIEQAEKYVEIEKKIDRLNTMVFVQQENKDEIIRWENILDTLKDNKKINRAKYLMKDYKGILLNWRNNYRELLKEINYDKKVLELTGADVLYTEIKNPVR